MVAGFNANVNGNFTNKFLVASHKTVPDVQLERFHGPLELEILLLDVLEQLVVDQVVVLEPDRHDDEGDEADEDSRLDLGAIFDFLPRSGRQKCYK